MLEPAMSDNAMALNAEAIAGGDRRTTLHRGGGCVARVWMVACLEFPCQIRENNVITVKSRRKPIKIYRDSRNAAFKPDAVYWRD